ncbi:Cytochrome c [Pseudodesulfovibrio hydrargyri]|uniref:Cytochrome c n=1 Tax=Pseudodesulfovibrio hydrargyri TaxID=2125990 RepID=A0A1J5N923_9BACT|nr:c-type cytochrome [Pseudodesulfovibrio hydrargyri]OIQ49783.1 Cytochrome c [Pseudodesulfovibrio hydrargyri]
MAPWQDLFLALPLPEIWLRILLFVTFGLHLLFVLLMLGTAMLGFIYFLNDCCSGSRVEMGWNQRVVKSHLGLKSLAVVLGVGPLLIIQVIYSLGFFTATGLQAFTWLSVIPLLILAFLAIELFEHKMLSRPWLAFVSGALGLGALLTVPAIFTGALSLMERPGEWSGFAAKALAPGSVYRPHWLFRYLHVLGAAIVFGAAFHLFFTAGQDSEKRARLRAWLFGSVLFQVAVGVPLLFTVADVFNWPVLSAVTLGSAAAMAVAWTLRPAPVMTLSDGTIQGGRALLLLLPVIFVSMLAARQFLQDSTLMPLHRQARTALARESADLARFQQPALDAFRVKLATVYDNGPTLYEKSCQPCHGAGGLGDGPAARRLLVRAEDIAAVRADRDYVRQVLLAGWPGSGMPYFTVFDKDKIDALLDQLDASFTLFGPTTVPRREVGQQARDLWKNTCATCHGATGQPSPFGLTLRPAPPDLSRFSLQPERSLQIITEGYPGTVMQPYRDLPEETRRDLVAISSNLRR